MSNVIKFPARNLKTKAEGKTLCRNGFHKWKIVTERKFDVQRGKLVTLSRCERCGKERVQLI